MTAPVTPSAALDACAAVDAGPYDCAGLTALARHLRDAHGYTGPTGNRSALEARHEGLLVLEAVEGRLPLPAAEAMDLGQAVQAVRRAHRARVEAVQAASGRTP